MAELIDMPKLSDTMTVGTVVSWLKKEGEAVASGDMIAEIETDKATMEMEVFTDGVLIKQYVKAGGQVAVGEPIAAIGEAGEAAPEVTSGSATEAPSAKQEPEKKATPTPEPKAEPAAAAQEPIPVTPAPTVPVVAGSGGKIKASPLAKRIAAEKGVDLSTVSGTGPGGRIIKADVIAASENPAAMTPAAPPAASGSAVSAPVVMPQFGESKSIPVSNMRNVIAKRLLQSKTEIPHFYLNIEVDMGPLLEMRSMINAKTSKLPPEQGGIKYSVNDFILKAATEALKKVPAANASWMGSTIEQHGAVHMAFAVAVDEGLVTPTIKDAHAKSLSQISVEAKELIKKAQSKKLKPDEMTGSTFTVSNLGMFGINNFYGIINPPNAAILSVGATEKKPVVAPDGSIVPGDRMNIGLSGDHRVVDGAVGAEYLAALRDIIENPPLMLI
jgi:pyruvate dehydrogenase E2 component (dihydrolipoamide acetyltransferase)